MDNDKRDGRRQASITDVSYEHLGLHFQGRISDLSEGGFFIDTINPLPEGTVISFRFNFPGDKTEIPVKGEARVVWQQMQSQLESKNPGTSKD